MTKYKSKECERCSEPFEAYRDFHMYCSRRCYTAQWREDNKEATKIHNYNARFKPYGITPEQFEDMVDETNGRCQICGECTLYRLHIDHDHLTGQIRGLLCRECNLGLGQFKDSVELLRKAADYVEV